MGVCTCEPTEDLVAWRFVDRNCSVHGDQAQPLPIANKLPVIHALVQDDLQRRLEFGIAKYGRSLQPHNGRNALRDLYDELLDACVYIRQKIWEEEHAQGEGTEPQASEAGDRDPRQRGAGEAVAERVPDWG